MSHSATQLRASRRANQCIYSDSIGDFEELEETTDYLGEFDLEADMML